MLCPIKFVDPSAHANMQCDPQCAWRAAEITNQNAKEVEVYYYCGLISNSTRVEMVNLDGPVNIPLTQPVEETQDEPSIKVVENSETAEE